MISEIDSILQKKLQLLEWGKNLKVIDLCDIEAPIVKSLHVITYDILTNYWNLAILSRSEKKFPLLSENSKKIIFRVRVNIEKSI